MKVNEVAEKPAALKGSYLAFVLDETTRADLLKMFSPRYEKVICHHVTLAFDLSRGLTEEQEKWLKNPTALSVHVKCEVDDKKGVQAIAVLVDKKFDRPDGSFYHVTLSLGPDRKPVESNKLKDAAKSRQIRGIVPLHGTVKLVKK